MNNVRGLYPPLYGAPANGGGGGGGSIQVKTLPEASLEYKDKIVQYTGATTETLTNGYFYKCVEHTETEGKTITVSYSWDDIPVMEVESGGINISDTETVVGTYYNKPLYARVIKRNDITEFSSSTITLATGLQNIDMLCDIKLEYKLTSAQGYGRKGTWYGGQPFLEGTTLFYIPLYSGVGLYNIDTVYVIILYTKTTD